MNIQLCTDYGWNEDMKQSSYVIKSQYRGVVDNVPSKVPNCAVHKTRSRAVATLQNVGKAR